MTYTIYPLISHILYYFLIVVHSYKLTSGVSHFSLVVSRHAPFALV